MGDDLKAKKARLADAFFEAYQRRFESLLPKAIQWARETALSSRGRPGKTTVEQEIAMAFEYQRREGVSNLSSTALKTDIGSKFGLRKTASIEAVNRGLDLLKKSSE